VGANIGEALQFLVGLAEVIVELEDFFALHIEVKVDLDLAFEDFRVDRLEDVIDRADLRGPRCVPVLFADRRHEDNRHAVHGFALLHQRGGLKTVHVRHLHIEQHDGKAVAQDERERLVARGSLEYGGVQRPEDLFGRQQVLLAVVDDQNIRLQCRDWSQ
jgi:hypothetical protein